MPTAEYGLHNLSGLNFNLIKKSLKKKSVTNDSYCKEFEKKVSKYTGSRYCIACNNGTSALLISILAIKNKNPIIIIPNINFISAANIVYLLGGKIVLCDVNEKSGMIDEKTFQEVIKNCKIKNIKPDIFMPIHYAGKVLDLSKISKICKKEKIKIIEDGCHSFGSSNKKNKVGDSKLSEFTTFSFHPVKNITTIEGGAITTNSFKNFKKLIELKTFSLIKTNINDPYQLKTPSLNFRMGEINAAIGLNQMKKIKKFKSVRQNLVNYYIEKFKNLDEILTIENKKDKRIFWHLLVIHLDKKYLHLKKKLMLFLKSKKIGTQIHYKPLSEHKILKNRIILSNKKNSIKFYKSQLTLPLHTKMKKKDIDYIYGNIKFFFKDYI